MAPLLCVRSALKLCRVLVLKCFTFNLLQYFLFVPSFRLPGSSQTFIKQSFTKSGAGKRHLA